MRKRYLIVLGVIFIASLLAAQVFADTSCQTKYPIILAHGVGFYPTSTLPNSFPGIVEALEACGAKVYLTVVEPLGTSAEKAGQFVNGYSEGGVSYLGFKGLLAATGASKFNIIGHSMGGLYTRYAISNLGIAPYVASHTSVDSPHRGSLIDSIGLLEQALDPALADALAAKTSPYNLSYIGNLTGVSAATVYAKEQADDVDLSVQNMTGNFNPHTPNMPGVYYQSWTCAYRQYNVLGSILAEMEELIELYTNSLPTLPNPADGMAIAKYIEAAFPNYAATAYLYGGGLGDGLVQVSSAEWGTFLGTQQGPSYSQGLNHFDAININNGQTWDAVGYWVKTVKDLKAKGF
jgi:triacylglycerol lipase